MYIYYIYKPSHTSGRESGAFIDSVSEVTTLSLTACSREIFSSLSSCFPAIKYLL